MVITVPDSRLPPRGLTLTNELQRQGKLCRLCQCMGFVQILGY